MAISDPTTSASTQRPSDGRMIAPATIAPPDSTPTDTAKSARP